ncbi:EAL domain-containing protein [Streptomyces sp. XM83C]|uniref:Bifunctional diguanylate cyclase/phosphodiesterase n=1 Tax=Streptomyces thermocoprophilus TaxID=78356 RepID=A0ABV5V7Z1_9ACTN|nr:EAL domain-containing protein [Streptomyces sp. XM83C]MCK1818409.1 EAL domain-containing protein [Streptomyces sp. XM83C]
MPAARRLMVVLVVVVGVSTGLYMTVTPSRTAAWAVTGLSAAAAVVAGVRLHRPARHWPWYALAGGLVCLTAGDTAYNVQESFLGASNPFPSPADAFYLAMYPLLTAGLFGLVRYRWPDRDLPSLLDALIITAGLALPVWVYMMQPLARQEGLAWQDRVVSVAYPLGDILVLAMLVRLLAPSPGSRRNTSVRLLVLGTVGLLANDIPYSVLQLHDAWHVGTLGDSGWVVFYAAWGLAALHPSMVELTEVAAPPQSLLPPWRKLALLTAATLVPPLVLIAEETAGRVRDATALAVFSGVLFLLVILRLAVMVVAHRKAVAREQALRAAASPLVASVWPQEIERACDRAVDALFGPRVPHAHRLLPPRDADRLYERLARSPALSGTRRPANGSGPARGDRAALVRRSTLLVPVPALGPELAAPLDGLPHALLCPLTQPSDGTLHGVLLAAGPRQNLTEMRGSLELLASHAALASERLALRRQIIRRESEAYFRTLVHNASDVILIVNGDSTVRYASPSAEAVFGTADLTGRQLPDLVAPQERARVVRTLTTLRSLGRQEAQDHWWVEGDKARIEVDVRCRDLRKDPTVGGLVVTLRDVTEQRQLEHELTQRAFHDSLTGLPNRTLLLERTERALLRGRRESTITCLLFIDLDDFKIVNDTMGHSMGDRLLCAVAERLSATLRRSDTAARLGGDEFAVLMEDAKQPLDAELLAAQVIQRLSRPFQLSVESVSVSASVGVATAQDSTDAEELLTLADLALYAAKAAGKRQWRRFQPQQRSRMLRRHDLQVRLDTALARHEFGLRYQPVVDIRAGEIVGFEALARWPRLGQDAVPPGQFIPLAEETGRISALGSWVLRNSTADIARLQRRRPGARPPYISVNVSARQWRDNGFLDEVCRAVESAGLAPNTLQLELTESVLMQRTPQIDGLLRALKDLGVSIAVDDFGTGFSSLRYLRDFPIDVLKIDKSFIDEIPSDPQQVALVEGIVHLADTLGLKVIAEGIETQEQKRLLSDIGCPFGQGFLFARPMTVEQSEAVLHHGNDARPAPDG